MLKKINNTAASDYIRGKAAIHPEAFGKLPAALKTRAFTVAGIEDLNQLARIRNLIAELPEGGDWNKLKNGIAAVIDAENQKGAKARAQRILRVNGMQAYAAGRYAQQQSSVDVWPYWEYRCMGDGNVRDSHRALDGKVIAANDPWWQTHYPPWEWGCRCMVIQLTQKQAEAKGITEASTIPGKAPDGYSFDVKTLLIPTEELKKQYGVDFEILEKRLEKVTVSDEDDLPLLDWAKKQQLPLPELLADNTFTDKELGRITANWKPEEAAELKKLEKDLREANRAQKQIESNLRKAKKWGVRLPEETQEQLDEFKRQKQLLADNFHTLQRKVLGSVNSVLRSSPTQIQVAAVPQSLKTLIADTQAALAGVFNSSVLPDQAVKIASTMSSRAFFDPNNNRISMNPHDSVSDVIHELSHWVEQHNPDVRRRCVEFLEYRTKSEAAVPLSRLTGHKYPPSEVAKPDNFFDPYCGKIYKNRENVYYGTEILSMGLEKVFRDPVEFAKSDREYFNFVVGVIKGRI